MEPTPLKDKAREEKMLKCNLCCIVDGLPILFSLDNKEEISHERCGFCIIFSFVKRICSLSFSFSFHCGLDSLKGSVPGKTPGIHNFTFGMGM